MGSTIIETTEVGTSIRCIRGPLSKMNIILKTRAGEEVLCPLKRGVFDKLPLNCSVEVFDREGSNSRKFRREFLEIVSNTEWNP